MANNLYWRLAKNNLVRNKRMYIPYAVATAIMSMMFFIIINIVACRSVSNMSWGATLAAIMLVGIVVMSIFTVCYMLYLNSFLIKRRKKEFGLYAILGLEKRHVCKIVSHESFILNAGSLILGLLAGTVFGKLIFLLLLSLTDFADGSSFIISPWAYGITALFFCLIFLVNSIYNQLQVRLANPIDLINGEKKAEKKVKGAIPQTIVGLLLLGIAYYASMTLNNTGLVVTFFWPAVLFVIFGTHLLFKGGSYTLLTALKKNKKFFYQPANFISVSGLTHRMKQNAAGLADICILSTMVLVTISSVTSLYFGSENILKIQNPNDSYITVYCDNREDTPDFAPVKEAVEQLAEKTGVTLEDTYSYKYQSDLIMIKDGEFEFKNEKSEFDSQTTDLLDNNRFRVKIITADDYNAVTGSKLTLAKNEFSLLSCELGVKPGPVNINGHSYHLKSVITDSKFTVGKNSPVSIDVFFVAADKEAASELRYAVNPNVATDPYQLEFGASVETIVNYSGNENSSKAFSEAVADAVYSPLRPQLTDATYISSDITTNRAEGRVAYGGLLFLGIYFAILFLLNTVLIMYFKQISEGMEDRERFVILQQVGMSDREVKKVINKQILTIFFLPLITALVHVFVCGHMLTIIINMFVMTYNPLTFTCIAVTSVIFSIVYIIVFRATARVYYKLVKR